MPILKTIKQHKVVFDTHVFIWHMFADPQLSLKFQKNMERYQNDHPVLLSPMTLWEVGMLSQKGRILLEMDCLDWVEQSLLDPGFELAPLTPQIAVMSSFLPGNFHGDPVDRILVATALNNHAVLVTCDEKILEYGEQNILYVHDPRK
jgi:PIN domain nuclease of toxin-antitoxin system